MRGVKTCKLKRREGKKNPGRAPASLFIFAELEADLIWGKAIMLNSHLIRSAARC